MRAGRRRKSDGDLVDGSFRMRASPARAPSRASIAVASGVNINRRPASTAARTCRISFDLQGGADGLFLRVEGAIGIAAGNDRKGRAQGLVSVQFGGAKCIGPAFRGFVPVVEADRSGPVVDAALHVLGLHPDGAQCLGDEFRLPIDGLGLHRQQREFGDGADFREGVSISITANGDFRDIRSPAAWAAQGGAVSMVISSHQVCWWWIPPAHHSLPRRQAAHAGTALPLRASASRRRE